MTNNTCFDISIKSQNMVIVRKQLTTENVQKYNSNRVHLYKNVNKNPSAPKEDKGLDESLKNIQASISGATAINKFNMRTSHTNNTLKSREPSQVTQTSSSDIFNRSQFMPPKAPRLPNSLKTDFLHTDLFIIIYSS
jgi:hypothetical protein